MEYLAVAAAVALVLPGSLFLIPSKRRLAIRLSLGVGALFAGLAVLTLGYYGVLFLALGRSPDFLDIDSCLDAGGMWNYHEPKNIFGAAPGESEAGTAVAVVVNHGAAVAQLSALETHA